MAQEIRNLSEGCYIEKVPGKNLWSAHYHCAVTGDSIEVPYSESQRLFPTEDKAIAAAEAGDEAYGLRSNMARARAVEALSKIYSGDFNATVHDRQLFNAVEPIQMLKYIQQQGWQRRSSNERKDGIQIWSYGKERVNGQDENMTILVCVSRKFSDYPRNVSHIIQTISDLTKRNTLPILMEMLKVEVNSETVEEIGKTTEDGERCT